MKCPKCNSQCWRDEHPDGYAYGLWSCSECDWYEKPLKENEKDKETESLMYEGYSLDDVKRDPVEYNIMDVI